MSAPAPEPAEPGAAELLAALARIAAALERQCELLESISRNIGGVNFAIQDAGAGY